MMEESLTRGFDVLVLTNAMRPMMKLAERLVELREGHGKQLTVRVSIDHYSRELHERERGLRTWMSTIEGLQCWTKTGFT